MTKNLKRLCEDELGFQVFDDLSDFLITLRETHRTSGNVIEYFELKDGTATYVISSYHETRPDSEYLFTRYNMDMENFDPGEHQVTDPEYFLDEVVDLLSNGELCYICDDVLDAVGFYDEFDGQVWEILAEQYDLLEDEEDDEE